MERPPTPTRLPGAPTQLRTRRRSMRYSQCTGGVAETGRIMAKYRSRLCGGQHAVAKLGRRCSFRPVHGSFCDPPVVSQRLACISVVVTFADPGHSQLLSRWARRRVSRGRDCAVARLMPRRGVTRDGVTLGCAGMRTVRLRRQRWDKDGEAEMTVPGYGPRCGGSSAGIWTHDLCYRSLPEMA